MGANFRSNPILERRNDLAARRVVFRIRREGHDDVERKTDWVALDLHVTLLEDVEQTHLDLAGQIR